MMQMDDSNELSGLAGELSGMDGQITGENEFIDEVDGGVMASPRVDIDRSHVAKIDQEEFK